MDSSRRERVALYCWAAMQTQLDNNHALEEQSARLHECAGRDRYEIADKAKAYEKGDILDRIGW